MAVFEQAAPQRAWPPMLAPLSLVAGFGGALVFGLVVDAVAAIAGASLVHPPRVVSLIATVAQAVAFVVSAVFFAAQVARPRPEHFGLRSTGVRRAALGVVIGYAVFLGFSLGWGAALDLHDKERLLDQLGANDNAVALVAVSLLTCVIAPICEELYFRGFFFTALRNWCGPWPAAAITGVVFGAIHAGSAPASHLVPLAFFGFVLCLVYWKTGSLYPCIALHALNNSVAVGITEHWGWQIPVLAAASLAAIAAALRSVARLTPAQ